MQALRCSLARATEAAVLRTMLPRPHAAGGSGPVLAAALANSCFSPGGALGQISVRCVTFGAAPRVPCRVATLHGA